MSKEVHLSETSPLWPAMWDALADLTGDYADCNPDSGEYWQYMGTYDNVHQFRHRHRPESCPPIKGFAGKHCDRVYLNLNADTLEAVRLHVKRYDAPQDRLMNCPRCAGNHPLRDCPQPDREQFEQHCSGAFDGYVVTSDADPGL